MRVRSAVRDTFRPRLPARLTAVLSLALALGVSAPAFAQETASPLAQRVAASRQHNPDAKMLVTAREMIYDNDRQTVSAVGAVQLYYDGSVLEAERVVYDQRNNRVHAYGNVKLTEPDGNVFRAETFELTEDLREGFVQSLLVETVDRTRFAAESGTRTAGNVTVLNRGVYTACEPCRENPAKPPLWQVSAARIVHDEKERMVYYEDARLEFFGQPIAWLPYLAHPDPTVRRKTGFLPPSFSGSSELGVGAEVPFFWAIAPNMDFTFSPVVYTEQGFLAKGEFRHRLDSGIYTIRAAGIIQADPGQVPEDDGAGDREERGMVQTRGRFAINEMWTWGWDVSLLSDRWFLDDYDLWGSDWSEATSSLFLRGQGDRSYFNLQGYHFYGLSSDDDQDELPIAAPVLDYNFVYDKPVFGGEWSANFNVSSIWREDTDLEPTTSRNRSANPGGPRVPWEEDENFSCRTFSANCIVPGVGGFYTRFSADTEWRRQIIDPLGQVWTPFAFVRADLITRDPENTAALASYLDTSEETFTRGMAGGGLEYRYPFVAHNALGSHLLEPIAQVILRPNESRIGELPNEDAQSLFFDDTTLFAWDKFSGYDRIEGGGRANVGMQYTLTFPSGGFISGLFGQSYHLFGENSFAEGEDDLTNTGLDSGLEDDESDYVASVYFQAVKELAFATRFRFDNEDFTPQAIETEARFNKGAFSGGVMYGRYEEQPRLGFDDVREGVLGNLKVQLTDTVYVGGAARYNLNVGEFDAFQVGIGYLDECFGLGLTYIQDRSEDGNEDTVHKVLLQFALRTLGGGSASTRLDGDDDEN